jgi:hypothetical protein
MKEATHEDGATIISKTDDQVGLNGGGSPIINKDDRSTSMTSEKREKTILKILGTTRRDPERKRDETI